MAERGERRKVPGKLTWLSDELHSECNTAVLQRARGITEPAFVGHGNSLLPGDVVPGIWEPDDVAKRG